MHTHESCKVHSIHGPILNSMSSYGIIPASTDPREIRMLRCIHVHVCSHRVVLHNSFMDCRIQG